MKLICGDCLEELSKLEDNYVDSIVTDPPYGLGVVKDLPSLLSDWMSGEDGCSHVGKGGFMGKEWDKSVPSPKVWKECLRVLKPGGHMLVFAGTRTQDLMGISIRLAGAELRDEIDYVGAIQWYYASGFPKGSNISKAIDKMAGAEREVVGPKHADHYPNGPGDVGFHGGTGEYRQVGRGINMETAPATEDAKKWDGWNTALKPAHEPILLFRKPLSEKTIGKNVLKHGCGALNIDGCRVGTGSTIRSNHGGTGDPSQWRTGNGDDFVSGSGSGRWPANLILHHSPGCKLRGTKRVKGGSGFTAEDFGRATCIMGKGSGWKKHKNKEFHTTAIYGDKDGKETVEDWKCVEGCPCLNFQGVGSGDGNASRFFKQVAIDEEDMKSFLYCAKTSRKDRNEGLEDPGTTNTHVNRHPTVKPTELCRYLCRLITPPGGTVLDPFMGSGSTGKGAVLEGFDFIGIEQDQEFVDIAQARIEWAKKKTDGQMGLFDGIDKSGSKG